MSETDRQEREDEIESLKKELHDVREECHLKVMELELENLQLRDTISRFARSVTTWGRALRPFADAYKAALAKVPSLKDWPDKEIFILAGPTIGSWRAAHDAIYPTGRPPKFGGQLTETEKPLPTTNEALPDAHGPSSGPPEPGPSAAE